jgi:hypothetical protein
MGMTNCEIPPTGGDVVELILEDHRLRRVVERDREVGLRREGSTGRQG